MESRSCWDGKGRFSGCGNGESGPGAAEIPAGNCSGACKVGAVPLLTPLPEHQDVGVNETDGLAANFRIGIVSLSPLMANDLSGEVGHFMAGLLQDFS